MCSSLKTIYYIVFLTLRPSRVRIPTIFKHKIKRESAKADSLLMARRKGFEPPTFWFVAATIPLKDSFQGNSTLIIPIIQAHFSNNSNISTAFSSQVVHKWSKKCVRNSIYCVIPELISSIKTPVPTSLIKSNAFSFSQVKQA